MRCICISVELNCLITSNNKMDDAFLFPLTDGNELAVSTSIAIVSKALLCTYLSVFVFYFNLNIKTLIVLQSTIQMIKRKHFYQYNIYNGLKDNDYNLLSFI